MGEKLVLTQEEAGDLSCDDLEGYKVVHEESICGDRDSTTYEIVVKRLSDGKTFMDTFSRGTSDTGYGAYEYEKPDFVECKLVERVIQQWVKV